MDYVKINYNSFSFNEMIISSFRYCLGRKSILSYSFVQFLEDNWKLIGDKEKDLIKKEIKDYKFVNGKIGSSSVDEPRWLQILEW